MIDCGDIEYGQAMTKQLVVVTGASQGIGLAIAHAFASEGHPLLLVSRHPQPLSDLPAERTVHAQVDVVDYEGLRKAIADAEDIHGPTGCLVNNAGFLGIGAL